MFGDHGEDAEDGGNEDVRGLSSDGVDTEGWLGNDVFTVGRPGGDHALESI